MGFQIQHRSPEQSIENTDKQHQAIGQRRTTGRYEHDQQRNADRKKDTETRREPEQSAAEICREVAQC